MTEEELQTRVIENIRTLRKKAGLSQEKLADKADISRQMMNDIEGRRRWLTKGTLVKLANALGVDVHELFIPAEKESYIANLIDEANGRGVAITTYSVWKGEVYNGRPLANSICSYLNAMGYTTDVNCSAATPDKLDIVIRWDNPKEDW